MCMNIFKLNPLHPSYSSPPQQQQSKRPRVRRLHRRRRRHSRQQVKIKGSIRIMLKKEMEIKNLELYLENRSIIEENEKLRHKALLLHQENSALLSQLLQRGGSSHPPTSAGDKKPQ